MCYVMYMLCMHLKGWLKVCVMYRLALTVLIQPDHERDINSALNLDKTNLTQMHCIEDNMRLLWQTRAKFNPKKVATI